jgi:hypothetical protein
MIKRFIRRMTEFDLIAFTSSVPMFRAFLAMLRAMKPLLFLQQQHRGEFVGTVLP